MIADDAGIYLVESFDEACEFKRWLGERRSVLAIDTETSGLDWWAGDLRLVQFGDTQSGWVIPYEGWKALVQEVISDYAGPTVYHNAKFDLHWLIREGCRPNLRDVHDTETMVHILEPLERAGLKPSAVRHVDPRADAGQTELKRAMAKAKWNWGNLPVDFEAYWAYAAMDVILTAMLWEKLYPQIQSNYRLLYDMEMQVQHVLREVETRGMRVDLEYCEQQRQLAEGYAKEARKYLNDTWNTAPSGKRLPAALLSAGVVLTKKTDTGGWSTDAEVLEEIDHPIAQTALGVRKAEKLAHSYFGKYLELADGDIVHPGIRPIGAKTGRMSIADPAMQQLPRGPRVRNGVIARDGNVLLGIDYEQVEMRLLAHLSGDPGLIAAFDGPDFFRAMARQIYKDPNLEKSDPRRQITKNAMYAKAYGSGVKKFAATAQIPLSEAQVFMASLDEAFPGMRQYSLDIQAMARNQRELSGRACVHTRDGRLLEVEYVGKEYKLVNALIQGTAADLLKQVILELDAAGLGDYIVLPVHDELIFDVPVDRVDEVQAEAVRIMTRTDYAVPLAVDPHQANRWGELK